MNRPRNHRVLLALMTVAGAALTSASVVTPWFTSTLSTFEGRGSYDTRKTELPLSEIGDWWGLGYKITIPVLVVLIVLASFGPVRARFVAGLVAVISALAVAASLVGGWVDAIGARQTFVDRAEEFQSAAPNTGYVLYSVGQGGIVLATIAWVVLLLTALLAVHRARSDRASSAIPATDTGAFGPSRHQRGTMTDHEVASDHRTTGGRQDDGGPRDRGAQ